MRPVKCEPMIDSAISVSPTCMWPCACSIAIRADRAVPVGERSILPGWIATADRVRPHVDQITFEGLDPK